jgi:hypothetical protein
MQTKKPWRVRPAPTENGDNGNLPLFSCRVPEQEVAAIREPAVKEASKQHHFFPIVGGYPDAPNHASSAAVKGPREQP